MFYEPKPGRRIRVTIGPKDPARDDADQNHDDQNHYDDAWKGGVIRSCTTTNMKSEMSLYSAVESRTADAHAMDDASFAARCNVSLAPSLASRSRNHCA